MSCDNQTVLQQGLVKFDCLDSYLVIVIFLFIVIYFNQPSAVRFVFKFFCSVSVILVSVNFTVSCHQCHTTTSVFYVI